VSEYLTFTKIVTNLIKVTEQNQHTKKLENRQIEIFVFKISYIVLTYILTYKKISQFDYSLVES